MTESTSAIERAVAARIQAARRRTEDMRRQRAELAAARRAGKAKAHAAKLRRLRGAEDHAGTGQPPTTAGQSPKVAKGTQIVRTPGRTSSPVVRGDTPTVADLRGPESNAGVTETATTDEDQA